MGKPHRGGAIKEPINEAPLNAHFLQSCMVVVDVNNQKNHSKDHVVLPK